MVAANPPLATSLPGGRLDRVVGPVRLTALALGTAAATAQLVDVALYDGRVRALDMMTHRSVFGALSLLALAAAASSALAVAGRTPQSRPAFACLAALLGSLLVLRVLHPAHVLLMALPLGAATLAVLWRVAAPGVGRRLLRDGCVVLLVAFAAHGIGTAILSTLGLGSETWAYQVKALLKHSGELAGWVLVAGGLAAVVLNGAFDSRRTGTEAA